MKEIEKSACCETKEKEKQFFYPKKKSLWRAKQIETNAKKKKL